MWDEWKVYLGIVVAYIVYKCVYIVYKYVYIIMCMLLHDVYFTVLRRPVPQIKKSTTPQPGTAPMNMENAVEWFKESEVPKGLGLEKDGSICLWFHGKAVNDACLNIM